MSASRQAILIEAFRCDFQHLLLNGIQIRPQSISFRMLINSLFINSIIDVMLTELLAVSLNKQQIDR
jgi:hypothetical protein